MLIEISDLGVAYGSRTVLSHVSLTVAANDFLGIIGPNGGGKTTLIRTILGLVKPVSGTIRYYKNGKPTPHLTMGYLPQYNAIDRKFPITVQELIVSGLPHHPSPFHRSFPGDRQDTIRQVIAQMGLTGMEHRAIEALSGGELQRALLGRAIVSRPDVLILDEPDTYIDRRFEARLYPLLEEINHTCAIILVSHDIGTILQNVKTIACVNQSLHYHPAAEATTQWIEKHFGCPFELLGHGPLPHRILMKHEE